MPVLFLIIGCIALLFFYNTSPSYHNDVVTFNRLAKEAAQSWEQLQNSNYQDIQYHNIGYPFCILSLQGDVLYSSDKNVVTSLSEALQEGNPIVDIERNGKITGKLIITKNALEHALSLRNHASLIIFIFLICSTLYSLFYYCYLQQKLLKPFHHMERFAAEISKGNLDFTLQMDKNNLFGAFTQSFDMMREQLLLAREQEAASNKAKKELIASLSHDIKTPVTSIKITSEFLLEIVSELAVREKLSLINHKAEQIEELVNNLFHTTLQDMESLTVTPVEVYSSELTALLQDADYQGRVILPDLPECLLFIDKLRLSQILSNVITNSYKYADTAIVADASITDTHLKLSFLDYGNSMTEEELPFLFNKFYRGKNAAEQSGSGLGLYICKRLLEQMQGDIYCTCSDKGFCVILMLKLA